MQDVATTAKAVGGEPSWIHERKRKKERKKERKEEREIEKEKTLDFLLFLLIGTWSLRLRAARTPADFLRVVSAAARLRMGEPLHEGQVSPVSEAGFSLSHGLS